jgi:hypothetical protein
LDITLQALDTQPRGEIDYRFAGGGDVGRESLMRLTHAVTEEGSILHVPVDTGVYCYSLIYKSVLPRDAPLGELRADEQQVRLQIIWIAPAAR